MSGHISGNRVVVMETRRRWSDEERQRAVEETLALPVSVVARKHGIAKSLLFRWRKEAGLTGKRKDGASNVPSFVPVRIEAAPNVAAPAPASRSAKPEAGTIEIELAGGHRLRITGHIHSEVLKQVIAALGG